MHVVYANHRKQPLTRYKQHTHENWEIILNMTGRNRTTIDGVSYDIEKNDVMVIPPHVLHGNETDIKDGDKSAYQPYTDVFLEAEHIEFDGVIVAHDYDGCLQPLMEMIVKIASEKERDHAEIADSLLVAVYRFIKKINTSTYRYPFTAAFKNILYEHLSDADFDLSEKIHHMGFSTDHFRRCFSADIGMTPHDYLINLRIDKATTLLRQPYMRISEIAEYCGFRDSYYFSKVFRKKIGMSPFVYRQKFLNS